MNGSAEGPPNSTTSTWFPYQKTAKPGALTARGLKTKDGERASDCRRAERYLAFTDFSAAMKPVI